MRTEDKKKVSSVVMDHWWRKFDKAILVLMSGGVNSDILIEKIKALGNEKNCQDQ